MHRFNKPPTHYYLTDIDIMSASNALKIVLTLASCIRS